MKTKNRLSLNLKPEEAYLLGRLPDVLRLEAALKGIRQKYSQFWDEILRRVQAEHPKLNWSRNQAAGSEADVFICRDCWKSAYDGYRSGLGIDSITFERLCSRDTDAPSAGIWIKPAKGMRIDLEVFRPPLQRKLEQITGQEVGSVSKSEISLWYDLPESREALLDMLTRGKEAEFADCMVSHFARLAKMIPMIDGVYRRSD